MTTAALPAQRRPRLLMPATLEVRADNLPAGICGRVEGVALVYDVVDTYGTTFARGCLARTVRERVAAGKVKLFWDHGDSMESGAYDTDLHIGTVRALEDVTLPDGRVGALMRADIFDTERGREARDYLKAVTASGGETGLSVGMIRAALKSETARIDGRSVVRFTEVGLAEISITAMPSVPGTTITAVRSEAEVDAVFAETLRLIRDAAGAVRFRALVRAALPADGDEHDSDASAEASHTDDPDSSDTVDPDTSDADTSETPADTRATMADRLTAVRQSYRRTK